MDHGINPMFAQDLVKRCAIADVGIVDRDGHIGNALDAT